MSKLLTHAHVLNPSVVSWTWKISYKCREASYRWWSRSKRNAENSLLCLQTFVSSLSNGAFCPCLDDKFIICFELFIRPTRAKCFEDLCRMLTSKVNSPLSGPDNVLESSGEVVRRIPNSDSFWRKCSAYLSLFFSLLWSDLGTIWGFSPLLDTPACTRRVICLGDNFLWISLQFPDRSWDRWGFASSVNTTAKMFPGWVVCVHWRFCNNLFCSLLHDKQASMDIHDRSDYGLSAFLFRLSPI